MATKIPQPESRNEAELERQLKACTPYAWIREYRWHPTRRFRADFAIWRDCAAHEMKQEPLLVEIDGSKRGPPGAHQRVDGVDYDCRRTAEAMVLAYRVLRVSSRMVFDGTALTYIERLIG